MTKFSIAALALVGLFAACETTKTAAPGAVGAKSECCSSAAKTECCKDAAAAPGAVSEKKADCSKSCSEKAACPATAAPGAVSEKKADGCCKKACPATQG